MTEVDMDLLLSVVKGLGSFSMDQKGGKVYCKDEDCLRKSTCAADSQSYHSGSFWSTVVLHMDFMARSMPEGPTKTAAAG